VANTFSIAIDGISLIADWISGLPSGPVVNPGDIVVTGVRPTGSTVSPDPALYQPSGYFTFDALASGFNFSDGFGGMGAPTSPLNTVLSHSTVVTVGHHNIYLPKNMKPEEQAAASAFIAAVATLDALVGSIPSTAMLTVVETWTDSSGVSHSQPLTESAADLQAHWANTSFGLFTGADYSTLNGPGTNGTGRGSSNIGLDPNIAGNIIAGFNIGTASTGVLGYYNGNGTAAMEYLALHEVAHNTVAGLIMNFATAGRTDVFIPGTPNWANENLANTFALVTMGALGLSLGRYEPTANDLTPTAGWETGAHWTAGP
jgi:hypothetical protein